jgi:hypothetical protein
MSRSCRTCCGRDNKKRPPNLGNPQPHKQTSTLTQSARAAAIVPPAEAWPCASLKRRLKQLGRPRIDPAIEKRIQAQLRAGLPASSACGTVQRVRQEMTGPFGGVAA